MEEEEVTLILQAKTEPDAFGRLYDRYYQPILGFLISRTRNAEVAKDLCSETFFQALKNIPRYEPRGKPFKSWLFAIAVAQIGTYYRSRKRFLSVALDEAPELMADEGYRPDVSMVADQDTAETRASVERLRGLLTQLNQKQQNILAMRFFSKLSVPEIASTLKMKEGTVKSHIHRALKKLNVLMTEPSVETYERTDAYTTRTAFAADGAA